MKITAEEKEHFTVVTVDLENQIIEPAVLKTLKVPEVNAKKGVVISCKGPKWLDACIAHKYHHTLFVAIYDPRIGAVITQSHSPLYQEGDILPII